MSSCTKTCTPAGHDPRCPEAMTAHLESVAEQLKRASEALADLGRRENALRAMVEQMTLPEHDAGSCGTNDCNACEWLAVADAIDWPSWREAVRT